jgi:hypothetical protein
MAKTGTAGRGAAVIVAVLAVGSAGRAPFGR